MDSDASMFYECLQIFKDTEGWAYHNLKLTAKFKEGKHFYRNEVFVIDSFL